MHFIFFFRPTSLLRVGDHGRRPHQFTTLLSFTRSLDTLYSASDNLVQSLMSSIKRLLDLPRLLRFISALTGEKFSRNASVSGDCPQTTH